MKYTVNDPEVTDLTPVVLVLLSNLNEKHIFTEELPDVLEWYRDMQYRAHDPKVVGLKLAQIKAMGKSLLILTCIHSN